VFGAICYKCYAAHEDQRKRLAATQKVSRVVVMPNIKRVDNPARTAFALKMLYTDTYVDNRTDSRIIPLFCVIRDFFTLRLFTDDCIGCV